MQVCDVEGCKEPTFQKLSLSFVPTTQTSTNQREDTNFDLCQKHYYGAKACVDRLKSFIESGKLRVQVTEAVVS